MSWKHILAATAVAALAAGISVQPSAAQNTEAVAAIVNDEVISSYDVRQRANLLLVSSGMQPSAEMLQRASVQALHDLVDEHLQIQETKGDPWHINITDAEVDRRLADIARSNNTTVEGFAQRLAQAGVNVATLRAQLKADMAWSRLMNGLYGQRIRVSDVEVRETQARIAASATSTHYLISEIFLPAETPEEFTQMQNGAMQLLQQMQQGAPFPAVARQFSGAPSSAAGGDIGWISASELPAGLGPVVEHLQPGQVSLPIRTQTGIYIVALREKQEGHAAGASTQINLRQVTAPLARRNALERLQRRTSGCANLERDVTAIEGGQVIDLGQTSEADLSPEIRARVTGVATGSAAAVAVSGDQVSTIFVCSRETGGAGVPERREIETRLFDQELAMLSERYLRNLRREATIITR